MTDWNWEDHPLTISLVPKNNLSKESKASAEYVNAITKSSSQLFELWITQTSVILSLTNNDEHTLNCDMSTSGFLWDSKSLVKAFQSFSAV